MKQLSTFILGMLCCAQFFGQTFSDDFESYSEGDYIGVESDEWTTWSGATGGAEDAQVVTDNANSGSQAIHFTSTSANGGPQDVVLPFGDEYNLGTLTFEMSFYVEEGNGGYFNFQGEETIGSIWSLDCNMVQDGMIYFATQGFIQIATEYELESWNDLMVVANMTINDWSIYLNGELLGSFSNPENRCASLDLFPVNQTDLGGNNNSSFWVDDVSYTYEEYVLQPLNLGVINNALVGSQGLAGQERSVSTLLRNLGTEDITSFDIQLDYNGNTFNETLSGLSLSSLDFYTYDFPDMVELAEGENDLVVTISNVNGEGDDDDTSDDIKELTLDPIVPAPGKVVVTEEATGTWCPWCPRGDVMMNRAAEDYEGYFAGIAVHNDDPMTVGAYDAGLATHTGFTGYPGATIDRRPFTDPLAIEQQFLEQIQIEPAGLITNGAEVDEVNGMMNVSLKVNFNSVETGNWKIACVLIEDGVTGTGSDWNQANAYAGGGAGEMGGYEDLPNPVPASDMVYNHVGRALSPNFNGLSNAFTDPTETGTDYIFNFSFEIGEDWNLDNMHIVGMLIQPDGQINNGSYTTVDDAESNGLETGTEVVGVENLLGPEDQFTIYPNPSVNSVIVELKKGIQIKDVSIYNSAGQLIENFDTNVISENKTEINISEMAIGLYTIAVTTDKGVMKQRLLKNK